MKKEKRWEKLLDFIKRSKCVTIICLLIIGIFIFYLKNYLPDPTQVRAYGEKFYLIEDYDSNTSLLIDKYTDICYIILKGDRVSGMSIMVGEDGKPITYKELKKREIEEH